jgi:hypothetical protein
MSDFMRDIKKRSHRPAKTGDEQQPQAHLSPRVWTSDQMAVANAHELEPIQKNINDSTQA